MDRMRKGVMLCILLAVFMEGIPIYAAAKDAGLSIDVGQPGQKTATYAVQQLHKWYLRISLPEELEKVSDLTLFQTLSPALTMDPESVGMKLVMESGEQILLRVGEHYQMTAGSVFVEEGISDRFCICLTAEGIGFLQEYREPLSELMVTYTAKINTHAAMGTQILGTAQMKWEDDRGSRAVVLSDKAAVSTGGVLFQLTDPSGNPLGGCDFMLAREATQKELEDSGVLKEVLDTGTQTVAVIYERFYTSGDISGEKTDRAVTDANGEAGCYGLPYGTYYLVQTDSPRSDLLPSGPVTVQIDESSHLTAGDGWTDTAGVPVDNRVSISATALTLPQTGGPGTGPYYIAGAALVLWAILLLLGNGKRDVMMR